MIYILGVFTLLHVLFYFGLGWGWRKISLIDSSKKYLKFSVIIPVRNESESIGWLLSDLEIQNYSRDDFEVIVVNDFSTDNTMDVIEDFRKDSKLNIKVLNLSDRNQQGKKYALTKGVQSVKYELVLTTDADCRVGREWLRWYSHAFDESVNMVAGPVTIKGKGLFAKLQQIEFAGLIGFGAVTIDHENPSMCSGANLGFRKSAFEEVGGYTNNLFIPSGDDEFLLYNIMKKFPHSVKFLKNREAIVETPAHTKWSSFMNQRTRWTSKWKYNKNWKLRISAILFFFDYFFFYAALILTVIEILPVNYFLIVFFARYFSEWIYLKLISNFLGIRYITFGSLILQIIYPIHVLFMGINSIFGSYTWKGRKYR